MVLLKTSLSYNANPIAPIAILYIALFIRCDIVCLKSTSGEWSAGILITFDCYFAGLSLRNSAFVQVAEYFPSYGLLL